MSAHVAAVTERINHFIKTNSVQPWFKLDLQGVVHMYTQYEDGIIKEFYSCSFKSVGEEPELYKINRLYRVFDSPILQDEGLLIRNVSYLEFDQTQVGPGKRYQVQFSFRG